MDRTKYWIAGIVLAVVLAIGMYWKGQRIAYWMAHPPDRYTTHR